MIRSFLALYRLDVGLETAHALDDESVAAGREVLTDERRASFYQRLDERLGAIGDIRGGAIASSIRSEAVPRCG
jgi:hypothetical protein